MSAPVTLRPAAPADLAAITAIYGHHVLHGSGTFEEVPPSEAEMAQRMQTVAGLNLPWLVAEAEGAVIGYAYLSPFRSRIAYRYGVEDSIYVAPSAQGRGVGAGLLKALIAAAEAGDFRTLIAVIGDSSNLGSIRLHEKLNFVPAGVLPHAGFKFGRWLDVVLMTLTLGAGSSAPPTGDGWGTPA